MPITQAAKGFRPVIRTPMVTTMNKGLVVSVLPFTTERARLRVSMVSSAVDAERDVGAPAISIVPGIAWDLGEVGPLIMPAKESRVTC